RERIGRRAVALFVLLDEIADQRIRIAGEVVVRIEAALERLAADLDELRRLPAVAARERHVHPEVARLDRDLADVVVVGGDVDQLRLRGADRGELRTEIAVAVRKALRRYDCSAEALEGVAEVLREGGRVVVLVVD